MKLIRGRDWVIEKDPDKKEIYRKLDELVGWVNKTESILEEITKWIKLKDKDEN